MTYEINNPNQSVVLKVKDGNVTYITPYGSIKTYKLNKMVRLSRFANFKCSEDRKQYKILYPCENDIVSISQNDDYRYKTNLSKEEFMNIVREFLYEIDDSWTLYQFSNYMVEKIIEIDWDRYGLKEFTQKVIKDMNKFIISIDKPVFSRETNNFGKGFDFIKVEAHMNSIIRISDIERKEVIVKNKKEIIEMVLDKIEKSIEKYGVSTNYLKLSNMTYRRKLCSLEFTFELKDELRKIMQGE